MKELKIKNILVPIDFSEVSIRVIPVAKHLAQRLGSTIHLANVQEPFYPVMSYGIAAPAPVLVIEPVEQARKSAAARLGALAKANGLTGTAESVIGAPVFDEICSRARRISADLIVTATHGHTGLKHLFLGSTAERLVQHSPCPVFVVRESKGTRSLDKAAPTSAAINTILVPVDFSVCSLGGLKYAIQLANKFAAKIIVLHVVDVGPALGADGYGGYELSRYGELAQGQAERKMPSFLRSVKFGGIKFETKVVIGRSVDAICVAAKKYEVDTVVIATHGRTGLKHMLIGSTAEVVVRYAPCPVLVVPSHPVERRKRLKAMAAQSNRPAKRRLMTGAMKQTPLEPERFTKRFRKIVVQPLPERRKTNKFRESHADSAR